MTTTDDTALQEQIEHAALVAYARHVDDGWCREPECEYRNWTSGSVPTHRRGSTCPPLPTLAKAVAAAVLPIIRAEVAKALRDAAEDLFYDGDNDRPMYGCHELYDRADRAEKGEQYL